MRTIALRILWDFMLACYLVEVLALLPLFVLACRVFVADTWKAAWRGYWERWHEMRREDSSSAWYAEHIDK